MFPCPGQTSGVSRHEKATPADESSSTKSELCPAPFQRIELVIAAVAERMHRRPARFSMVPVFPVTVQLMSSTGPLVTWIPPPSLRDTYREDQIPLNLNPAANGSVRSLQFETVEIFWTFFWAIFVIALLAGTLWLIRRHMKRSRFVGGGDVVSVLARTGLDSHSHVFVVDVGNTIFLVGGSRDRLAPLGTIRDPEEVAKVRAQAAGGSVRSGFDASLAEQLKDGERSDGARKVRDQLGRLKKTIHNWGKAGA